MSAAAPRFAPAAAARVQTQARRAGGAWNRHDTSSVREVIEVARELRLPRVFVEYGGLRFRFDLQVEDGAAQAVVAKEQEASALDDVQMGDGQQECGPAPAVFIAGQPLPDPRAPAAQADAEPSDLQRLRERALVATERRRRQKAARKARDEAARLLAAQTSERSLRAGGDEASLNVLHVPLWSTSMGESKAMMRAIEEVTSRCVQEAQSRGLSTRAVPLVYSGARYSVTILSGTVASGSMSEDARGKELLALLGRGLTEEGLRDLLSRWSQPQPTGSNQPPSTKKKAAFGGARR